MISILYTEISSNWDNTTFKERSMRLPEEMQQKIFRYKNEKDKQLRIAGKFLIEELLKEIAPGKYSLADLKYDEFNKPFINDEFNFSVSYAEEMAVCAATAKCKVGIDAEMIKPFDAALMQDHFTKPEWIFLEQKNFEPSYFYYLWTRKEALLKAAGKGIYENFANVDVLQNEIELYSNKYFLKELFINQNYCVSLATTFEENFTIRKVNF